MLSELEEQLAVLEGRADGAAFSLSFAMDSGELMADVQDMMGFSATSAARLTEHCQHNGSRAHGGAGSMEEDEDGSGPAASVRLIAKLNALIAPTPGCTHKPAAHASSIATQTDSLPPLLANLTGMSAAFGSVSGFGSGSGLVASPRMSFEASMPKRALSTGIWQRQGSMGNEGSPHNSSIFSRMQPGATPNTAAALGTQSLASVSALNATGTSAERTPAASLTDGSVQGTLIIGDIERSGSPGLSWAAWRQQASAHLPLPACMDEQTSSATGSCVLLAACMPSHTRALQSTQGVPHLIQPVHTSTEVSLLAATDCSAGVVTSATSQSSSELDQIGFDAEAMPAQPAPPSPPKTPSVFPLQPLQPPPQPKSSIGKIAGALTMDNAKGIGALRCAGVCSNLQDDPSLGSFDDALPLPLPLPLVI